MSVDRARGEFTNSSGGSTNYEWIDGSGVGIANASPIVVRQDGFTDSCGNPLPRCP